MGVFCSTIAFSADFQKGLNAAQQGNFASALEEWERLAEQGNVDAQVLLGSLFSSGEAIPQDYEKAAKWFTAAAEQGEPVSQYGLGVLYHDGTGVPRDYNQAMKWLEERRREEHRVGLLASSGAVRLVAEGIPPSPRSNELRDVIHWFLRPTGDYRSSNALETPLSEFVCQGLEIDYVGLCWGYDLI